MSNKQFCVNAVVSSLLHEYVVQPDYTQKREEIEAHEFVCLDVKGGIRNKGDWCKILFTTSDTAIVQEIELTHGHTRFQVFKVHLSEWDTKFVEWLDNDWIVQDCSQRGMRMYGARV